MYNYHSFRITWGFPVYLNEINSIVLRIVKLYPLISWHILKVVFFSYFLLNITGKDVKAGCTIINLTPLKSVRRRTKVTVFFLFFSSLTQIHCFLELNRSCTVSNLLSHWLKSMKLNIMWQIQQAAKWLFGMSNHGFICGPHFLVSLCQSPLPQD